MYEILQALLALLAAAGLLALGWVLFGRLVTPVGGRDGGPVYAVVPADGGGEHLEQDVRAFCGCGAGSWPGSPSSLRTTAWMNQAGQWRRLC